MTSSDRDDDVGGERPAIVGGGKAPAPSIRRRLTFALGTIALTVFGVAGLALDWALMRDLQKQELAELAGRLAMARHVIEERVQTIELLRHELDDMLQTHPELRLWVIGDDGYPLYGGELPKMFEHGAGRLTMETADGGFRGLREPLRPGAVMKGGTLMIGVESASRDRLMLEHRLTLILVTLAGTVLIVVLTAWATGRGLAPISTLSRDATRITPDALGMRLSVEGAPLELHALAQAFNRVLDRLEEAYRQLDAFNADVAHELRTPLATMISGTEVMLSSSRSPDELREMLSSNLEELEGMKRLVNDMLFLARADRGERPEGLNPISVAGEARAVAEYFEATLQESKLTLIVKGDATVVADAPLLRRALANLLSNAVRYASTGSMIELDIETDGTHRARIVVRNRGQPVEPSDVMRMFDRFYRGTTPAARPQERHGLGLSIVRAIARMHGGSTFASSTAGVTEVGFTIGEISPAAQDYSGEKLRQPQRGAVPEFH